MLRVVLDCNVFVSALLSPNGSPAQILDGWADGDFEMIVSPLLLAELERVLSRTKFAVSIDSAQVDGLVTGLMEDGLLVEDPPADPGLTPDPGDDYLVALAGVADAQCIVSGDAHLRQLADAVPPVLSPAEFIEREKWVPSGKDPPWYFSERISADLGAASKPTSPEPRSGGDFEPRSPIARKC